MTTAANDRFFLRRCSDLAQLATSVHSPNPRVGAVLVYDNKIIGEGYHKKAGEAHAEVNCLASVNEENRKFISKSTIYVSLEPCCFHGRTPACTSLIIEHKIPVVVIGSLDQTAEVSGKGVDILSKAGVTVRAYPDFVPTIRVAEPRQLFAASKRPYILLKFAKSADGFLAPKDKQDYWITEKVSRRLVHFWRSRTRAIIVGAGTFLQDDPKLDTRLYPGASPRVIVFDPGAKLDKRSFRAFDVPTKREIILIRPEGSAEIPGFIPVFLQKNLIEAVFGQEKARSAAARQLLKPILALLHGKDDNHLTVEGGSWLLHLFITADYWDEARVFTGTKTYFGEGLPAPIIPGDAVQEENVGADLLQRWRNE